GQLADGRVFDSSTEREPMRATLGQGEIIPCVDEALVGMTPGEEKKIEVASDEAYGPRRPELVQQIERAKIPSEVDLEVGTRLGAVGADGQKIEVTVVEIAEDTVTLDANHPLAGQDLVFDLKLLEVA
ncbi:MAG TPA: FKBP-type peptidyl-prolyl cis-trans isomerase, partial [Geminicoccaceae bacterium]